MMLELMQKQCWNSISENVNVFSPACDAIWMPLNFKN
jgi:hypothetical protein